MRELEILRINQLISVGSENFYIYFRIKLEYQEKSCRAKILRLAWSDPPTSSLHKEVVLEQLVDGGEAFVEGVGVYY